MRKGVSNLPAVAAVTMLVILTALVPAGTRGTTFGWYRLPLYPFLCLAGGLYLHDLLRRPDFPRAALFSLPVLFLTLDGMRDLGIQENRTTIRIMLAGGLLPFAVHTFFPNLHLERFGRSAAGLLIALAVGSSLVAILFQIRLT